MQLHEAIMHVQDVAQRTGIYRDQEPACLSRLHEIVRPVYSDLEEEPILGFTNGRDPAHPPTDGTPAYISLHTGVTSGQMRLAYAYLAAWLLVDARGCTVPLPPRSFEEASALSEEEAYAWCLAIALLLPPTASLSIDQLPVIADRFAVPEPLLAIFLAASQS